MNTRSLSAPLLGVLAATAALLLVPAVAVQFTDEVRWGPGDFIAAGGLLLVTGAGMVLAMRLVERAAWRAGLVGGLALALLVTWAELAVGLFT